MNNYIHTLRLHTLRSYIVGKKSLLLMFLLTMLLNYELTTHLENNALWCHSRYRILSSWIGGLSTGEAAPLSEIKIFNTRPFNAVVLQPKVLSASSRFDSDEQKWLKWHVDMLKHESSSWPSQPLLQQQWKVISWGWEMWKGQFGNSMKFLDTWQKHANMQSLGFALRLGITCSFMEKKMTSIFMAVAFWIPLIKEFSFAFW